MFEESCKQQICAARETVAAGDISFFAVDGTNTMDISHPQNEILPTEEGKVYCTLHPTVETTLRCNRCGRPMCAKCARRTPVGYRCQQCVRQQQDVFFNAEVLDYLITVGVSLVAGFFAAFFMSLIGWFFIAFFIGPAVGGIIGQIILKLTRKRRGRYTAYVVGACLVLSALPFVLTNPLTILVYLFMSVGTAVAQFGLRLNL